MSNLFSDKKIAKKHGETSDTGRSQLLDLLYPENRLKSGMSKNVLSSP